MIKSFKQITTPDKKKYMFPTDITLVFPEEDLPPDVIRNLVYIPWNDKYGGLVPQDYRDFFKKVLPYLHTRTTDVHTAVSMSYLKDYLQRMPGMNERVVAYGLILHDCGWSALTNREVAASLSSYKGLQIKGAAIGPKEKHAVEGEKIARKILEEYNTPLSETEKDAIYTAVRWHDSVDEARKGEFPKEVSAVIDLDHLWSFTYLNFWQDTVRKGVQAREYLQNLENDLEGYFILDAGKSMARSLLDERRKEVDKLHNL